MGGIRRNGEAGFTKKTNARETRPEQIYENKIRGAAGGERHTKKMVENCKRFQKKRNIRVGGQGEV